MLNRNAIILASAIAALSTSGLAAAAGPAIAAARSGGDPSVVIVHGAFADGSDWARVIPLLQAKGIKVQAVQNSLTSLRDDVATTRRAIDNQPGNVVLVGHSWGGTVITEAGQSDKVSALVYVAAFAPDAGQSTEELGKGYPTPPGIAKLVADAEGYLSLPAAAIASDFAQDLPPARTRVMAATQGPIQAKAFGETTTGAAWKGRPSWYIVSEKDRMIQPELQRAMATRIKARITSLPTSHVPQQSRPEDVAKVILEAVRTARAARG
ncbi:alpha/beta fold hydrolase [Cupriavidus respiraculi]|uniref:Pyrethroid hydrolase n=1 Tax=Cupriavidus respiraculi TaxID=195930 RepID=A0ABM8WLH8_9BURK|nr:alpha/beta hydrolase [Cupriavidus respiraculi]MBY4947529.1 alpha/beta hydrolase [Cupriavidus respiraculi]CAG9168224.1 Pyrethroid hydrolase [Cupriavidus respiraculi]